MRIIIIRGPATMPPPPPGASGPSSTGMTIRHVAPVDFRYLIEGGRDREAQRLTLASQLWEVS